MTDATEAQAPEATAVKPQVSKTELKGMQEFHIDISWAGIKKAVRKALYEGPFELYQDACIGVEKLSRKMMTGKASLLGMPVGIILRNTARAMHNSSRDSYFLAPRFVGGLLTAGAVIALGGLLLAPFAAMGIAAAGALFGVSLVTGGAAVTLFGLPVIAAGAAVTTAAAAAEGLGLIATWGAAALATALVAPLAVYPVFTAATLATSTVIGGVVAAISTVFAAPLNLKAGWNRAKAARKGVELTDEQIEELQTAFDRESPIVQRDEERLAEVFQNLSKMSPGKKKEVLNSLKEEFGSAAAQQEAGEEAAPAVARQRKPR
jgi:hypothetical protein